MHTDMCSRAGDGANKTTTPMHGCSYAMYMCRHRCTFECTCRYTDSYRYIHRHIHYAYTYV